MFDLSTVANRYLKAEGDTCFRELDASDVRAWLERNGYKVIANFDTGRYGAAVTECGYIVSTNGHVSHNKIEAEQLVAKYAAPKGWDKVTA